MLLHNLPICLPTYHRVALKVEGRLGDCGGLIIVIIVGRGFINIPRYHTVYLEKSRQMAYVPYRARRTKYDELLLDTYMLDPICNPCCKSAEELVHT